MSKVKIPEDIAALTRKIGQQFKSEQDHPDFSRLLKKLADEAALRAKLDEHLGYTEDQACGRGTDNSCNGYSRKIQNGDQGKMGSPIKGRVN